MPSPTLFTSPSPTLDPFTQSFSLLLSDGTPVKISVPDLDDFILYNVQICINYSSQLGASLLLLIVLLILTKSEKRRSPIFVINALALAINTIRSVLQCLYFTGPFSEVYAYFAQDFSRVTTSAKAISIAGSVLTLLLLTCLQLSLILQTMIICTTVRDFYRLCIAAISLSIALIAVGFRFALVVENSKFIINAESFASFAWLGSATNITATISICFYCLVFVTKLGFALYERKKLGIQQFGPMQIIFIMGCQTLIIPAIFSILQYFTDIPEMGSNVLTLVAIFLPLSSMWASSSVNEPTQASSGPDSHRKFLDSYSSGSSGCRSACKPSRSSISPISTTFNHANHVQTSLPNPANGTLWEVEKEANSRPFDHTVTGCECHSTSDDH